MFHFFSNKIIKNIFPINKFIVKYLSQITKGYIYPFEHKGGKI